MQHFLNITDFEPKTLQHILDLGVQLHQKSKGLQKEQGPLSGKSILFVFEKPSLRTKLGTEIALNKLGAHVVHVDPKNVLKGKILYSKGKLNNKGRESLKDTVHNISQWCDAIFARVFEHESLSEMADFNQVPVINALCDQAHPMQALADMLTIQEQIGKDKKTKISFVGDSNNVAFSLMEIALKFGHEVAFSGPKAHYWSELELDHFSALAEKYGGGFSHSVNPEDILLGSEFIYSDTFVSMGEEDEYEKKIKEFSAYQVNSETMEKTQMKSYFMHCLPAHRGEEVTDEVIDSKDSLVYKQAKNRMVTSMGLFTWLLMEANS